MRHFLLALLLPAVAIAQPAPPVGQPQPYRPAPQPAQPAPQPAAPQGPPQPYQPAPSQGPQQPYQPAPVGQPQTYQPQPYPPPPPGGQPSPYPYQQPAYPPPQQPPPPAPVDHRQGMTIEASIGLALLSAEGETSDAGLGLAFGIGAFVMPRLAISGRLVATAIGDDDYNITQLYIGPSVQYWVASKFWLGGGLGIASTNTVRGFDGADRLYGLGLDLRGGFTFSTESANTMHVSLELTPGDFGGPGREDGAGVALLFGYQHL